MIFDSDKFRQIVLYIINTKYGSQLGNTRLNKILWFSDLENYSRNHETITGETYIRRDYGPVSKNLLHTLEQLKKDGFINIERIDDESMWLYYPLKKADISFLQEEQKNIIDGKINELIGLSASDLSKITHTPLWQSLGNGEEMPIRLAYAETLRDSCDVDYEAIKWDSLDV